MPPFCTCDVWTLLELENPGENVFRAYSDVLRRRNVSTALSNFIVPVIYYSKRKLVRPQKNLPCQIVLSEPGDVMTSISAGFPNLKIHIFFEKLYFLRDRPQRVSVNGYNYMSEEVVLISGARQWCVLSPMLFSIIYELHEFALNCCSLTCLFKLANDMALFGLLLNELIGNTDVFHMFHSWMNGAKKSFWKRMLVRQNN